MNRADKRELDLIDKQIALIRAENERLDLENGELRKSIALESVMVWNLRVKVRRRLRGWLRRG